MGKTAIPPKEKVYEGSSKILYVTEEEYTLIQFFKDDHVLGSGDIVQIPGKGIIKNSISAFLMEAMKLANIPNHLIEKLNMREQRIALVDLIPVQICVANVACGRYATEFGIEEGFVFDTPMIDFRVKNSEQGNPVTNEQQIAGFGWTFDEEIKELKAAAVRVSDFLIGLFAGAGIRMVECQLEFGRGFDGNGYVLILADEITPDSCRLWDIETNRRLDFEAPTASAEEVIAVYQEVAKRLGIK